jgi:hypothetical protein
MLARLLPIILAVAGLGVGAGAGLFLRPPDTTPEPSAVHAGEDPGATDHDVGPEGAPAAAEAHADAPAAEDGLSPPRDYVKLNNQFVIPVVEEGRVSALVILSLSLEVTAGMTETVYQIEPKLRDSLLQVMFDHANSGGFKGTFTDGSNMVLLRHALLENAQRVMGKDVTDVLIVDIVRQDS